MKIFFIVTIASLISACSDGTHMFYTDDKCNGIPDLFERYLVDKERQTVLMQLGSVYGTEVKEENAKYLDSCTVTDTNNFVCNLGSTYQFAMSNGTLIKNEKFRELKTEDCTYIKVFWGYKRIADATIKNTMSPPSQNK